MNRLGEHTQHSGQLNDAYLIATRDSKKLSAQGASSHSTISIYSQFDIFFCTPKVCSNKTTFPFFSMGI